MKAVYNDNEKTQTYSKEPEITTNVLARSVSRRKRMIYRQVIDVSCEPIKKSTKLMSFKSRIELVGKFIHAALAINIF